jgi:hypothetical protein
MNRLLWTALLSATLASCATPLERRGGCSNPISDQDFFGDRRFFFMDGLAKAYYDMGEPSLACEMPGVVAFRYSYPGGPVPNTTIRATSDGRNHRIHVIRTSSANEGLKFQVLSRTERRLSATEWAEIESAVAAVDFWNSPQDLRDDSDRVWLHAKAHVVEGRTDVYHAVEVFVHGRLSKLEDTLRRLARVD